MNDSNQSRVELRKIESVVFICRDGFSELGLSYVGAKVVHSKVAGDSETFTFRNPGNGIGVEINIFPGLNERNRGFVAIITRRDGSALNLNEYLRVHGREDISKRFTNDAPVADIAPFVEANLETLLKLLSTDLRDIIDGVRWESVPIDWKGYR
jgi:hypothetical protein